MKSKIKVSTKKSLFLVLTIFLIINLFISCTPVEEEEEVLEEESLNFIIGDFSVEPLTLTLDSLSADSADPISTFVGRAILVSLTATSNLDFTFGDAIFYRDETDASVEVARITLGEFKENIPRTISKSIVLNELGTADYSVCYEMNCSNTIRIEVIKEPPVFILSDFAITSSSDIVGVGEDFTMGFNVESTLAVSDSESFLITLYRKGASSEINPAVDSEVGQISLESINANSRVSKSFTVSSDSIGEFYYGACLNNFCSNTILISVRELAEEGLAITNFRVDNVEVVLNDTIKASFTINRVNIEDSSGVIKLYRSDNGDNVDGADSELAVTPNLTVTGDETTVEVAIIVSMSGEVYYYACINTACSNTVLVNVRTTTPDLVLSDFTITPISVVTEEIFMASVRVANRGLSASAATTVSLYSTDNSEIDTSISNLVSVVAIQALLAGATTDVTFEVRAVGSTRYGVCIGNVCTATIEVEVLLPTSNLIVFEWNTGGNVLLGTTIPATYDIINISSTTQTGTVLDIYRSDESVITFSNSIKVKSIPLDPILGYTIISDSTTEIVTDLAGNVYYRACIETACSEPSFSDIFPTRALLVEVDSVSLAEVFLGQNFDLTFSVRNNRAISHSGTVKIYRSDDMIIDTTDLEISTTTPIEITNLAAGQTEQTTTTITTTPITEEEINRGGPYTYYYGACIVACGVIAQVQVNLIDNGDLLINIETVADLVAISDNLAGTSKIIAGKTLMCGLDGMQECIGYGLRANLALEGIANWSPIGDDTTPFSAVFDGGGFTISNFTISSASGTKKGFFGKLEGATVRNFTIEDPSIMVVNNINKVGGLAGEAINSTISNINLTISSERFIRGNNEVGGLVGVVSGGEISNINLTTNSDSFVIRGNRVVGGLAGLINDGVTISNVFSSLNVTANGSVADIGGLVGKLSVTSTPRSKIENSGSSGHVLAIDFGSVGGLVGNMVGGEINNSWASGSVRSDYVGTRATSAGGLVGSTALFAISNFTYIVSIISNSWASGSVSGVGINRIGGLIGDGADEVKNSWASGSVVGGMSFAGGFAANGPFSDNNSSRTSNNFSLGIVEETLGTSGGFVDFTGQTVFEDNYWNTETSTKIASASVTPNQAAGVTTAEMLSSTGAAGDTAFSGWGNDDWDYRGGNIYPITKANIASADFQSAHQIAGLVRLLSSDTDFLGGNNSQYTITINRSVFPAASTFRVDINAGLTDIGGCVAGTDDVLFSFPARITNDVGIEVKIDSSVTSERNDWTGDPANCAVEVVNQPAAAEKFKLLVEITKGEEVAIREFIITFE